MGTLEIRIQIAIDEICLDLFGSSFLNDLRQKTQIGYTALTLQLMCVQSRFLEQRYDMCYLIAIWKDTGLQRIVYYARDNRQ